MPTSHPSGWAHADGALSHNRPGGPSWLREPSDPNEIVPLLWSSTAEKTDGVLSVGGVALPDLVQQEGSPAYVLDEADFRARARAFKEAFACGTLRTCASSSAMVCSAAATMFDSGAFATMMPRLVAAGTSTLSTPIPARPITLRRYAASMRSAVSLVAERITIPS